jgi:hypothetical protein
MRYAFLLLLAVTATAWPQNAISTVAVEPPPKITAMEKWGLTMEQYRLVHPSRRPSGDTFKYWRARGRGPYGNLLERIPGGPLRPVNP